MGTVNGALSEGGEESIGREAFFCFKGAPSEGWLTLFIRAPLFLFNSLPLFSFPPPLSQVTVFEQEHYLANFVQATFDALKGSLKGKKKKKKEPVRKRRKKRERVFFAQPRSPRPGQKKTGQTLVVSGDGRYYSKTAIDLIVRMAAANGVARVWVGVGGLMSTPAVSAVVRGRERGAAAGAFILTASHNPGGPTEDFGIKYNCDNGGPAPESLTDAIYERTKTIDRYFVSDGATFGEIDLSKPSSHDVYCDLPGELGMGAHGGFKLQVIDPVEDYLKLLKTIYDFGEEAVEDCSFSSGLSKMKRKGIVGEREKKLTRKGKKKKKKTGALKSLLARPDFSFLFDGMHGVAGPYAHAVFVDELGADAAKSLVNCTPKEDFGGG